MPTTSACCDDFLYYYVLLMIHQLVFQLEVKSLWTSPATAWDNTVELQAITFSHMFNVILRTKIFMFDIEVYKTHQQRHSYKTFCFNKTFFFCREMTLINFGWNNIVVAPGSGAWYDSMIDIVFSMLLLFKKSLLLDSLFTDNLF